MSFNLLIIMYLKRHPWKWVVRLSKQRTGIRAKTGNSSCSLSKKLCTYFEMCSKSLESRAGGQWFSKFSFHCFPGRVLSLLCPAFCNPLCSSNDLAALGHPLGPWQGAWKRWLRPEASNAMFFPPWLRTTYPESLDLGNIPVSSVFIIAELARKWGFYLFRSQW